MLSLPATFTNHPRLLRTAEPTERPGNTDRRSAPGAPDRGGEGQGLKQAMLMAARWHFCHDFMRRRYYSHLNWTGSNGYLVWWHFPYDFIWGAGSDSLSHLVQRSLDRRIGIWLEMEDRGHPGLRWMEWLRSLTPCWGEEEAPYDE